MNRKLLNIQKMVNPEVQKSKLVILVSGQGTSGKDHLIKKINKYSKKINAHNRSTIDVFKSAASKLFDWDGSKDYDSRLMLHEFKEVFIKYNEFPTLQAVKYYNSFIEEDTSDIGNHPSLKKKCNVLFIHIREWEEIEKFKEVIGDKCKVVTLLVKANKDNIADKEECACGNISIKDDRHGSYRHLCKDCGVFSCLYNPNSDPGMNDIDESNFDIIFENNFNNISEQQFARLIESEYNKLLNEEKRFIYIVNDPKLIFSTVQDDFIYLNSFMEGSRFILNGSYSRVLYKYFKFIKNIDTNTKKLIPGLDDPQLNIINIKDFTINILDNFFSLEDKRQIIFGTPYLEENKDVYDIIIKYLDDKGIPTDCVKRIAFYDDSFTTEHGKLFASNLSDNEPQIEINPDDFIHIRGSEEIYDSVDHNYKLGRDSVYRLIANIDKYCS